jgi:hypothetical protein
MATTNEHGLLQSEIAGWLQPFCDSESTRYEIDKPWRMGDYVYATNGIVCVRIADDGEWEESQKKKPNAEALYAKFPKDGFAPLRGDRLIWCEHDARMSLTINHNSVVGLEWLAAICKLATQCGEEPMVAEPLKNSLVIPIRVGPFEILLMPRR